MAKSTSPKGKRTTSRSQTRSSASKKPARATARTSQRSRAPAIKSYQAALSYLNTTTNYERMLRPSYSAQNFNLSRMNRLLVGLDNPHKTLKCVHIAGTKGKGSTCYMLSAMLEQAGYRVGLYTSPHVVELRERVMVNHEMISETDFTKLIARIAPIAAKMKDTPTFFEIMTAVAFLYFQEQATDLVVLETGLGGRLDSTNVVKPLACGMTAISYDHMAQLGNTLEKIATEKAGIFKPGIPVISGPQAPEVVKVFREMAAHVGAPLKFLGQDIEFSHRFESSRIGGPQNRVCMSTASSRFDHLEVPLYGEHQAYNCGLALGLVDVLTEHGYPITPQDAIDGLAKTHAPGRVEVIRNLPLTVVDVAHNSASIIALMRAIGQSFNYDSMVVIFGASADKDIDGMLQQLRLGADKVIFTSNGTPRSADPHELQAKFQELTQKMAQVAPTLEEAYEIAGNCVTRDDLICITGSVYIVGAAKSKLGEAPGTTRIAV
jgi:dihydrofolate synthase / folylpolyglutamate synthase